MQALLNIINAIEVREGTSKQSALRDVLTDLRHIADREGLDFDLAVEGSAEVHAEERELQQG